MAFRPHMRANGKAVLTFSILLASLEAYSGWTRIGLEGIKVTSITAGKAWGDSILAAGTDSGVYYRLGNGAFKPLTNQGSTVMPAGPTHVRALYLTPDGSRLFAGSDSGLYVFRFTSGLPPLWTKIAGTGLRTNAIAGLGDTMFTASGMGLYKSFDGGQQWSPCTLSFTKQLLPVYTSLAFWGGINVGSDERIGGLGPWMGVAHSPDYGQTWNDISNLAGQAQPLKAVYCLSTYSEIWYAPRRLIAGTAGGVQWIDNLDTGTWSPLDSQLTKASARHLYVTTYSKSNIAMLFASTDSGIFILRRGSPSGQWQCTLQKRAYAVTSFGINDPAEWFAAVEDGVYRYDMTTSTAPRGEKAAPEPLKTRIIVNNRTEMINHIVVPIILYSPSGKKFGKIEPGGVLRKAPLGIFIIRIGSQ